MSVILEDAQRGKSSHRRDYPSVPCRQRSQPKGSRPNQKLASRRPRKIQLRQRGESDGRDWLGQLQLSVASMRSGSDRPLSTGSGAQESRKREEGSELSEKSNRDC